MLLKGKVILVAGAGGLLGREIVRSISQQGGYVIATDISTNRVSSIIDECGGDSIQPIVMDICSKDSINAAIEAGLKRWKRIDGAVNTSYPRNENYGRKFFDVTYEDFCENVSLHLGGYFLFMQQCAAYSKVNAQEFSLVNISSIYGVIAPKFDIYDGTNMTMPVEYAAIKSAILHLNQYLTAEMKNSTFRVNSVSPGGIQAGQSDRFLSAYRRKSRIKGMLNSSDILGAVNFILSDSSRYICGQNIVVDDGFSIS